MAWSSYLVLALLALSGTTCGEEESIALPGKELKTPYSAGTAVNGSGIPITLRLGSPSYMAPEVIRR